MSSRSSEQRLFEPGKHIRPEDVRSLVDLRVAGNNRYDSMAQLQEAGIAALYNILCEHPFAYLADEVGMGKTYQALGLSAIVWNLNPEAEIVFISPRQALQEKWVSEYNRFFANNYRRDLRSKAIGDDCVTSLMLGRPIREAHLYQRLSEWAVDFAHPHPPVPFLRHTSFMRPVYVTNTEDRDLQAYWAEQKVRLAGWGLHNTTSHPGRASPREASRRFNLAFAKAFNRMLDATGHTFDLVVVDEGQCLRHIGNQTNEVFYQLFQGHVKKWLFLSATPVHSGPEDLRSILNRYPDAGEIVREQDVLGDLDMLQERIKPYMVRRQRKYVVDDDGTQVAKTEYRIHEQEAWAERTIRPLATLSMGLIQKGLVELLEGKNNRYRIGFLSSFESLQSSVQRIETVQLEDNEEKRSDWYRDRASIRQDEAEAPDSGFVSLLSSDFKDKFGIPLPHPKVDMVVDAIAPRAFGDAEHVGGEKFLVFTRRISTVEELRDRLDRRYHQSIEERVKRVWREVLDWTPKQDTFEEIDIPDDDPEYGEPSQSRRQFRRAMAQGGWLYRYRQTFRGTGRNALFFDENWLYRLCRAGGRKPAQVASAIPEEIWAESWAFASRSAGKKTAQHRSDRLRYLTLHALERSPECFGFTEDVARTWLDALVHIFPAQTRERKVSASDPHFAPELFSERTIWTEWSARFNGADLQLPGESSNPEREELFQRAVLQTLIGQSFRLTDTLLDLYFSDGAGHGDPRFLDRFFDWLTCDDPSAEKVRRQCQGWIDNLTVIMESCFDHTSHDFSEIAGKSSFKRLNNPTPVIGVTGGSGVNRTAIRQFRMPTAPQVIVCTDTLKEGVDLHLFCDQVVHYGVAWTSGDLEQRIGRVDRFFSQIERRLRESDDHREPKLEIYYPHLINSLERQQVKRVIVRQKDAEALLDMPLGGTTNESKYFSVDELVMETPRKPSSDEYAQTPFEKLTFPEYGFQVTAITIDEVERSRAFYSAWIENLVGHLDSGGYRIHGRDRKWRDATKTLMLIDPNGARRDLTLRYDAGLHRYTLTIAPSPWDDSPGFSGGRYRRIEAREEVTERFFRVVVPKPTDPNPEGMIPRILAWLGGEEPVSDETASAIDSRWNAALQMLTLEAPPLWSRPHRGEARVLFEKRGNRVVLYTYSGIVRIVAPIARIKDLLPSERWGGEATEETVQEWALRQTEELSLGFLDLHDRDGLCYAVRLGLGDWSVKDISLLIKIVAKRADSYEAALVGEDKY